MVMAIIGGAVFPAIMGRIPDATNIQTAFIVPLICYVYILYFALAGYKPSGAPTFEQAVAAEARR
jgi:FHS family L-fucose permease-like MFS transporter